MLEDCLQELRADARAAQSAAVAARSLPKRGRKKAALVKKVQSVEVKRIARKNRTRNRNRKQITMRETEETIEQTEESVKRTGVSILNGRPSTGYHEERGLTDCDHSIVGDSDAN